MIQQVDHQMNHMEVEVHQEMIQLMDPMEILIILFVDHMEIHMIYKPT